ncbi:MAG: hypothetical protein ACYDB6_03680, partial [Candidatus Limnocylindrales bacterium]
MAVVVGEMIPPTSEPLMAALIGPSAAPTSAEIRRPETVIGSMLRLSAPRVVTVKDVPAGPSATVAPSDPGAESTGVPEKWTVDALALSVIVTVTVPLAFGNPLTLFSVRVKEAVPTDVVPGDIEPADVTEVDASAGVAAIAAPSVARSVAARPRLAALLVMSLKAGNLQLSDGLNGRPFGSSESTTVPRLVLSVHTGSMSALSQGLDKEAAAPGQGQGSPSTHGEGEGDGEGAGDGDGPHWPVAGTHDGAGGDWLGRAAVGPGVGDGVTDGVGRGVGRAAGLREGEAPGLHATPAGHVVCVCSGDPGAHATPAGHALADEAADPAGQDWPPAAGAPHGVAAGDWLADGSGDVAAVGEPSPSGARWLVSRPPASTRPKTTSSATPMATIAPSGAPRRFIDFDVGTGGGTVALRAGRVAGFSADAAGLPATEA